MSGEGKKRGTFDEVEDLFAAAAMSPDMAREIGGQFEAIPYPEQALAAFAALQRNPFLALVGYADEGRTKVVVDLEQVATDVAPAVRSGSRAVAALRDGVLDLARTCHVAVGKGLRSAGVDPNASQSGQWLPASIDPLLLQAEIVPAVRRTLMLTAEFDGTFGAELRGDVAEQVAKGARVRALGAAFRVRNYADAIDRFVGSIVAVAADHSEPTVKEGATPAAKQQARRRRRKALGFSNVVQVAVNDRWIRPLVRTGYLEQDEADDPSAIQRAITFAVADRLALLDPTAPSPEQVRDGLRTFEE